ncbi:MAG: DUF4384 domain-containing protein [Verrucomicrobia bacterium]|nr:DUF4384 domain-containing protein [Verrucomicrobiota bacterium]
MNLDLALQQRAKVEEFQRKHRIGLLTLLFTDMVGSTQLKQELGDHEAVALIQHHHDLVREILGRFTEGEEIGTAGDSFFVVFARPSDAVQFSLLLQSGLRLLSQEAGRRVLDRVGVHIGEVVIEERPDSPKPRDLYGLQVDICARVMSLAEGNQILMTRSAFDNARQILKGQQIEGIQELLWLNHGSYTLKGVADPMEVCEVGEAGQAVLKPPGDSEKAHRYVQSESATAAKVATLPAGEVLKIAFAAAPPLTQSQPILPKLQFEILAKRPEETAFHWLADGDTLRSEVDDYLIVCQPLTPGYLYVFQVDSSGHTDWLFPQNPWSNYSSGSNPVVPSPIVQIPATDHSEVFYLDRTTGVEHVYAVFSALPWPDLEAALRKAARSREMGGSPEPSAQSDGTTCDEAPSSPSPPPKDERAGEKRDAGSTEETPLPSPLPAAQGEGIRGSGAGHLSACFAGGTSGRVETPNRLSWRGVGGVRTNLAAANLVSAVPRVHHGQTYRLELGGQVLEAAESVLAFERWFKHVA